MARPREDGRKYFRLYVDFFQNKKTKAIKRAHGTLGVAVYLNILCRVNANGYYYKFDDFDELVMDIAEEIVGEREQLRHVSAKTAESIHYMADKGYFDKSFFEMNILTSRPIQEEYIDFLKASKRKGEIGIYNLVDADRSAPKNECNSEETDVNSEETAVNSEKMPQSKVNEIITTTTTDGMVRACARECGTVEKPVENSKENIEPLMSEVFMYFYQELCIDNASEEASAFYAYNANRGWDCLPDWKKTADLWAARIRCPKNY